MRRTIEKIIRKKVRNPKRNCKWRKKSRTRVMQDRKLNKALVGRIVQNKKL